MLLKVTVIAGLALCAQLAHAAEAGKVIFAAGSAQLAERAVTEGAAVQEGDLLQTGADGFLYVKTVDNGLFILRPNTRARIVSYHIDAKNPANTRIKLDLISGVARSRSGDAVKQARQNFRFNTPVAAIGVRGTDFTVFTDENTSRVSVISGGVVVSGFAGACRPEGTGPCEGSASRELSAAQRGQLLQIQRGTAAPQLMSGSVVTVDQPALPAGAPLGSAVGEGPGNAVPVHVVLDAKKTESLTKVTNQVPPPPPPPVTTPEEPDEEGTEPPPVVMPPPVISPPPVVPPVVTPVAHSGIVWGRWQRVTGPAPDFNLTLEMGKHELVAVNGNFAVFRTAGQAYATPERGSAGFALADSQAFIYTHYGTSTTTAAEAVLSNGKLSVDFGSRTFATSFNLSSRTDLLTFYANGTVGGNGTLYGDRADGRKGFMNVQGLLSNDKGGSAAYVFDGRIDDSRTVNGVTHWSLTAK